MILVLGGTTEGRQAAQILDEAGSPYYYSTKTGEQQMALQHGRQIHGPLDYEAMTAFCRTNSVALLVDAAHPFAAQLHQTVSAVASRLGIPAIRFERIFPARDPSFTWLDDYASLLDPDFPLPSTLLATTGVQTIARLKPLEARGVKVFYRVLRRPSSLIEARRQGATDEQLCFYEDGANIGVEADAILMKESGLSGGFAAKTAAAQARGMRILVLKRPETPEGFLTVNGPYGLRRLVERLLPDFYPLHSGLTTGTCATAAAVAAAMQLMQNETPAEVPVILPDGETISVPVGYGADYAYCIKRAGDDPDVTDGLEIRAHVSQNPAEEGGIAILGGRGIGTFTLPGFDYPPGSPAINRTPREMIRRNLSPLGGNLRVTLSVPDGERVALKTFNPRLGIEGGISIIGVSGIVKPFSEEAFVQSIHRCMQVAKASGTYRVVINSGAKSERFVKARYPDLPQQAFVEYGNYIGATLQMAHELGFQHVTLGVMLGKAVKLANGQLDTHSRRAVMDKEFIARMLSEAGCAVDLSRITLARELWEAIPANKLQDFACVVIGYCRRHCEPLLPSGELTILLIDDQGNIYS